MSAEGKAPEAGAPGSFCGIEIALLWKAIDLIEDWEATDDAMEADLAISLFKLYSEHCNWGDASRKTSDSDIP